MRPDFVITHYTSNFVSVFINQIKKNRITPFIRTDYTVGEGCYGSATIDIDRNGALDIVTANYRDRTTSLLNGRGNGTFHPVTTTFKGLHLTEGNWISE